MIESIKKINKQRETVKAYSDKKISKEDWDAILDTIYWAPSSLGWEPYRVLIINKDNKLREELKPLMWNQGTVTESDKLIFFISLNKETITSSDWVETRIRRKLIGVMGKSEDEITQEEVTKSAEGMLAFLNSMESVDDWAMKQAYIALGMAMSAATLLDISTTPIEGFMADKVRELFLNKGIIKPNENVALSLAFGYVASETAYAHFGKGGRVRDPKGYKFTEV